MEILITSIGILGALVTLTAFILNQNGKLSNESLTYDILNVFSGLFLALYAFLIGSIPFMIINLVWGGYSLYDILKGIISKKGLPAKSNF